MFLREVKQERVGGIRLEVFLDDDDDPNSQRLKRLETYRVIVYMNYINISLSDAQGVIKKFVYF